MISPALVQQAYDAGLCVIPPAQDGSKRPTIPGGGGWKAYQQQRQEMPVLTRWYAPGNNLTGMGLVCFGWDEAARVIAGYLGMDGATKNPPSGGSLAPHADHESG